MLHQSTRGKCLSIHNPEHETLLRCTLCIYLSKGCTSRTNGGGGGGEYIMHSNLKSWSKTLCKCVNMFWIKVKGYEHVTKLQVWTESVQLCIHTIVKSKQTSGGRRGGGIFTICNSTKLMCKNNPPVQQIYTNQKFSWQVLLRAWTNHITDIFLVAELLLIT